jgi:Protein of unknown function (DUF2752)
MLALKPIEKIGWTMAALAAIVGIWLLRTYDPNMPGSLFPQCLFKAMTGFHCIGCGLTRAMHALVHGDIAGAFAMNPLAMLVLPLIPLMLLDGRGATPQALKPFMSVVMQPKLWLVLLPAYWIARNLPWWPFTWLAPG